MVYGIHWPIYPCKNGWCDREGGPLLRENLAETDPPLSKTPISSQCSLVCMASAVTHRKSTTSFPMSLRWTVYTFAPSPPPICIC